MSAGIAEAESRAASPCLKTGTLRPGPVLHDLSKNPRTLKPDEAAPISPHEKGHASQKQKEKKANPFTIQMGLAAIAQHLKV